MKIIAAVDRSDYADRVIEFTCRLAEGRRAAGEFDVSVGVAGAVDGGDDLHG